MREGISETFEGIESPIYVCKRPGVDDFLRLVSKLFEVVVFTASLCNYADRVIDFLDKDRLIRHRLYRESCLLVQGLYIKVSLVLVTMQDLARLGRDIGQTVIVDNSPASYLLHPEHAVAVKSWFSDSSDTELLSFVWPTLLRFSRFASVNDWRADLS